MNEEPPIQMQNVTRGYGGGPPVLQNFNLTVKQGSIYGFLGRNGAGKTTAIRMLAGLNKPKSGTVRVLGADPFTPRAEARQSVGYMSERPFLNNGVRVRTLLEFERILYPTWDAALAESLISKYSLSPSEKFNALSLGKQRLLAFVLAIAPRPKVLILDEPAANLDAVARREILDDILDLIRDSGSTVLFSTHVLSDIERVADEVGILANGYLRVSEPLDHLKDSIRQIRFFGFKNGIPQEAIPSAYRVVRGRDDLVATLRISDEITPELLAARWLCEYEIRPLNLEDIFVELSLN